MIPEGTPIERILKSLQERAKELDCHYRVDELFKHTETPLPEIFGGLLQAIPPGYQYPHICQVRITYNGATYLSADFRETPWLQSAIIAVDGERLGKIEVFYTETRSRADEGPFLKEERRLIDTIADRLGHFLPPGTYSITIKCSSPAPNVGYPSAGNIPTTDIPIFPRRAESVRQ